MNHRIADSIFITGVSAGIGLALAKASLQRGSKVFGISRREPSELLRHPNFQHRVLDLAELDHIKPALTEFLGSQESLQIVILNAAILGRIGDLSEASLEELKHIMDVNVWANKVVLDSLFGLGLEVGQVVSISSGAAASASRGWSGYSISKAALNMLTGLYAAERTKTHFCALAPGLVDTAMQEYVSRLPRDQRFPTVETLKSLRGTAYMPEPDEAAERLWKAMAKARKYPSGSFLDVETLVPSQGQPT